MITITIVTDGQTDGQTDRQTTCDRNTALCTKVHRAVTNPSFYIYWSTILFYVNHVENRQDDSTSWSYLHNLISVRFTGTVTFASSSLPVSLSLFSAISFQYSPPNHSSIISLLLIHFILMTLHLVIALCHHHPSLLHSFMAACTQQYDSYQSLFSDPHFKFHSFTFYRPLNFFTGSKAMLDT